MIVESIHVENFLQSTARSSFPTLLWLICGKMGLANQIVWRLSALYGYHRVASARKWNT
jgi:hypothetical protein